MARIGRVFSRVALPCTLSITMLAESKLRFILFVLATVAVACAADTVRRASAAEASITASTQPAGSLILHLADAEAAHDLEHGDWEIDMQSQIPFKDRPIFFGQLATYGADDKPTATIPIIGFKNGDELMAMKIDDPRLVNAGWSYIAAGPTTPEFWGVLDASLDDHQPEIVIAHSTDAGDTLVIASIPKPLPVAMFDSFSMDKQGHGRLSLYVYRDQAKARQAGYYHYRTIDGGKNWTGPEHEPDAMLPAEDAPDDVNTPAPRPAKA